MTIAAILSSKGGTVATITAFVTATLTPILGTPIALSLGLSCALIAGLIAEVGAAGPKDMGRVMTELKARHMGVLDMSRASAWVKEALQNR